MTGPEVVLVAAVVAAVLLLVPAGAVGPGPGPVARGRVLLAARVHGSLPVMQGARKAARTRAACLDLLDALAAELRAGRPAPAAVARAAAPHPGLLVNTLGAHRLGGDLPAGLDLDAAACGAPVLRRLAACWRVGESSGAGLADAVGRLAVSTRESERVRLELSARTAEPRATMRVLATLPAFGLALGAGLGADTLGWLFGTPVGRIVLVVGLLLEAVGLLWSRRMIATIEAAL